MKKYTRKQAEVIADYLSSKIDEMNKGFEYWDEISKQPHREEEANANKKHFTPVLLELNSFYNNLKFDYKLPVKLK